jgi:hypothetical protein
MTASSPNLNITAEHLSFFALAGAWLRSLVQTISAAHTLATDIETGCKPSQTAVQTLGLDSVQFPQLHGFRA